MSVYYSLLVKSPPQRYLLQPTVPTTGLPAQQVTYNTHHGQYENHSYPLYPLNRAYEKQDLSELVNFLQMGVLFHVHAYK